MSINTNYNYDIYSSPVIKDLFVAHSINATSSIDTGDIANREIIVKMYEMFAEIQALIKSHPDKATLQKKYDELYRFMGSSSVIEALGGVTSANYMNYVQGMVYIKNGIDSPNQNFTSFMSWCPRNVNEKAEALFQSFYKDYIANLPVDGKLSPEQMKVMVEFIQLLSSIQSPSIDQFFKGNAQMAAQMIFAYYYETNGHDAAEASRSMQKLLESLPPSDSLNYSRFRNYVQQFSTTPPVDFEDSVQRANWFQDIKCRIVDWLK